MTIVGANTLTFVIPAEIFPTCYRCTCHGISAAAGKVGSMIAIVVVYGINAGYRAPNRQGLLFLLFSAFMAMGAAYSWAYLPNVQRRMVFASPAQDLDSPDMGSGARARARSHLETKSLEDLGEGRERARRDGEFITVREKVEEIKRRRRRGLRGSAEHSGDGYGVEGHDIGMG